MSSGPQVLIQTTTSTSQRSFAESAVSCCVIEWMNEKCILYIMYFNNTVCVHSWTDCQAVILIITHSAIRQDVFGPGRSTLCFQTLFKSTFALLNNIYTQQETLFLYVLNVERQTNCSTQIWCNFMFYYVLVILMLNTTWWPNIIIHQLFDEENLALWLRLYRCFSFKTSH